MTDDSQAEQHHDERKGPRGDLVAATHTLGLEVRKVVLWSGVVITSMSHSYLTLSVSIAGKDINLLREHQ